MKSLNTPYQLSRRHWLRDAAIATTSAAVLPSLLTGCTDHRIPPDVGIGDPENVPLTNFELYSAAQNLLRMNDWIKDLYPFCIEYELYMYSVLKSGEKPSEWKDFIVDIFADIAIGILEAASIEIPFASAVIAIAGSAIKTWGIGNNRPPNLDAEFAEFVHGHIQMQIAISNTLLTLADETDNYRNLRESWPGEVDFNGKKYILKDLAGSQFPTDKNGTEYVKLRTAAFDRFKKYIWNVMILKAGSITYSSYWSIPVFYSPDQYGRETHYKDYPATYLRGWYEHVGLRYYFRYWYLTFDDRELSPDAAKELFKDDSPEHIINSNGLFNRDYVFKQFHKEKPDFFGYHDLKKNVCEWPDCGGHFDNELAFDLPDDFVFTGGDFPQLIKK